MLANVIEDCTALAPGLRIETATTARVSVLADSVLLEQALQNLAANALRFAPAGSTVSLRAHAHGDTVVVTVEDEGPGIEPAHLPRVFDRFYKAESAREATAVGSGLGLSIVKAIAERHGGRVGVESRPGRTVFSLTLRKP